MGAFIAKQPNGLYCRYSTTVDNITHYNMTKEDYIEFYLERAREEAIRNLENALNFDTVLSSLYPDTKRDLKKMNEILKECGSNKLLKEKDYDL